MEQKNKSLSISICMGSSCFSRGNNENLTIIQKYLAETGSTAEVELVGCLCQNTCNSGPIITINNKIYTNVEPITVVDILAYALKGQAA